MVTNSYRVDEIYEIAQQASYRLLGIVKWTKLVMDEMYEISCKISKTSTVIVLYQTAVWSSCLYCQFIKKFETTILLIDNTRLNNNVVT